MNGYIAHLVNLVANVAPWLAPIPTAWLIADRTMTRLGFPLPVAVAAAATLEALGVAIAATALDLYRYQRTKRKSDPDAPMWIAVALIAGYLLAALLLVLVLDLVQGIAVGAQAVFPLLSLAAMVLLALRMDQAFRLAEVAQNKAEAKQQRAERNEKRAKAKSERAKSEPERTESEPDSQAARYVCEIAGCGFASATQNGINAHMRSHRAKGERT